MPWLSGCGRLGGGTNTVCLNSVEKGLRLTHGRFSFFLRSLPYNDWAKFRRLLPPFLRTSGLCTFQSHNCHFSQTYQYIPGYGLEGILVKQMCLESTTSLIIWWQMMLWSPKALFQYSKIKVTLAFIFLCSLGGKCILLQWRLQTWSHIWSFAHPWFLGLLGLTPNQKVW